MPETEGDGDSVFYDDYPSYLDDDEEDEEDDDEYYEEDEIDEDEDEDYEEQEPADPKEKIKEIHVNNPSIYPKKVDVYPLIKGQTFREIRADLYKGGGRLIINSQKDIEDLKQLLEEIDKINKSNQDIEKKTKPNRFSDIEIVTKQD